MNLEQDEIIMTGKFKALLDASPYSTIPVDYPGTKQNPSGGKVIRFNIRHVPETQYAQVGGNRRRNFGSALIQIVLPTGSGQAELLKIADMFSTGFHKYRSGGLRCRPASLSGPFDDGSFIRGTVDVPYISDYSV